MDKCEDFRTLLVGFFVEKFNDVKQNELKLSTSWLRYGTEYLKKITSRLKRLELISEGKCLFEF